MAFCILESDKEIEPFERLVDESRPRLYKKVKNYVGIYFEYYQQGRRPMEAAIIQCVTLLTRIKLIVVDMFCLVLFPISFSGQTLLS